MEPPGVGLWRRVAFDQARRGRTDQLRSAHEANRPRNLRGALCAEPRNPIELRIQNWHEVRLQTLACRRPWPSIEALVHFLRFNGEREIRHRRITFVIRIKDRTHSGGGRPSLRAAGQLAATMVRGVARYTSAWITRLPSGRRFSCRWLGAPPSTWEWYRALRTSLRHRSI